MLRGANSPQTDSNPGLQPSPQLFSRGPVLTSPMPDSIEDTCDLALYRRVAAFFEHLEIRSPSSRVRARRFDLPLNAAQPYKKEFLPVKKVTDREFVTISTSFFHINVTLSSRTLIPYLLAFFLIGTLKNAGTRQIRSTCISL